MTTTTTIKIAPASTLGQFYSLNDLAAIPNGLSMRAVTALISYINNYNNDLDESGEHDWSEVFANTQEYTCAKFCKAFRSFFSDNDIRYIANLSFEELTKAGENLRQITETSKYAEEAVYLLEDDTRLVADELIDKYENVLVKNERYLSAALTTILEVTDISYYDFIELDNGDLLAIKGEAVKAAWE